MLLEALKPLGTTAKLQEDPGEVAISIETERSLEDAKKKADRCKLKMEFRTATGILRYTSLEASAAMLVAVTGHATPRSKVIIDGFKEKINIGASGEFTVQVPLSLIRENESRGYIHAKCKKGSMEEDLRIPIPE